MAQKRGYCSFCSFAYSIDAKSLYAVLATFVEYKTGGTYVTNGRLQLDTGHGLRKIKTLLNELQRGGFISRRGEYRRNLKAKRYIRCLKYVVSEQKTAVVPTAPGNKTSAGFC
jgi:hypothetical protein